jgi:hypothetical protein
MSLTASDQAQLNSLQQTQQESINFEIQMAQLQMTFQTHLDAAKSEKDAAQALQQSG